MLIISVKDNKHKWKRNAKTKQNKKTTMETEAIVNRWGINDFVECLS